MIPAQNTSNLAYSPDFSNDKYLNYYAVIESDMPEGQNIEIKKQINQNVNGITLSFLRFTACLQTFNKRNRNRRLWTTAVFKPMLNDPILISALKHGLPGENGHPVPPSGECTMERLLTIDPNNISHRFLNLYWKDENTFYGEIETLDEGPGTPGVKFMRDILQGLDAAFSLRSIVPQRKNIDGTIDVTGPGRIITYDRVFNPSHEEAYMDKSFPIKNVITAPKFQTVMESYQGIETKEFTDYVMNNSEKMKRILNNEQPVMESTTIDKNGVIGVKTRDQHLFIAPENHYRKEFQDLLNSLR
jgi:hypothetical protein